MIRTKSKETLMEKRRCNIRDLAQAAKLSPGTVSRILNNRPGDMNIPETTRRRVVELAREMQYVPNIHAQRLFSKNSGVIGLVIPSAKRNGAPVFAEGHLPLILAGMEERLDASSRRIELIINNGDFIEKQSYLSLFRNGSLDGLLVWGAYEDEQFWQELVDARFPYVFIGTYPRLRSWVNCVSNDYAFAAGKITENVLKVGHRQVLFLDDAANRSTTFHRKFGVAAAIEHRRMTPECVRYRQAADRDEAIHLLNEERDGGFRYTAVVTANFRLAVWAREALTARGLRIPEDVSIATGDAYPGEAAGWPELTRIETDDRQIGAEACRAIESIIDADDPFLINKALEGTPIYGNTVRSLNGREMD